MADRNSTRVLKIREDGMSDKLTWVKNEKGEPADFISASAAIRELKKKSDMTPGDSFIVVRIMKEFKAEKKVVESIEIEEIK